MNREVRLKELCQYSTARWVHDCGDPQAQRTTLPPTKAMAQGRASRVQYPLIHYKAVQEIQWNPS